jgi:hypothetical protein
VWETFFFHFTVLVCNQVSSPAIQLPLKYGLSPTLDILFAFSPHSEEEMDTFSAEAIHKHPSLDFVP